MIIDELLLYREDKNLDVVREAVELTQNPTRESAFEVIAKLLKTAGEHGFYGNLWHCFLTNILVNNENTYSLACEMRGDVEGTVNVAALHDMEIFRKLYDINLDDVARRLKTDSFDIIKDYTASCRESSVYNTRICKRICDLSVELGSAKDAKETKDRLTHFYKEYGVGQFGLNKSFRIKGENRKDLIIEPIINIAHVKLDDLVGLELQKKKLTENTEAFVKGKKANNCLLFGDAGTGKSSSIKAITNEYYEDGLRVIEIYKHQFRVLNDIIDRIKNRNYRFIIYMDDLSFEDFETEYKYLKAVIEGSLMKKPSNVLIYATSNRRHLIREQFSDREEGNDKHYNDTVQEKLSLAYRFGESIYFSSCDKKEFKEIVLELAKRNGIHMDEEELLLKAGEWELSHGGL
ncbi:MAG: ATP-binding protein, partial [Lachnospiraceae bacterium]|nr:ATP-binding protein [Lachnospiraceae bacterium]